MHKLIQLSALAFIMVIFVCSANVNPAHPASGHSVRDMGFLFQGGKGLPAEWSHDDIVFPGTVASWSQLSDAEKYILAGTTSSSFPDQHPLLPWTVQIITAVVKYCASEGYVPAQLTPVELRKIPELKAASDSDLSVYRSPITNEWPRLDQKNFSSGGVYIRPLKPYEKEHYANLNHYYRLKWYHEGSIVSDVFYTRFYGERGILAADFEYVNSAVESSSAK